MKKSALLLIGALLLSTMAHALSDITIGHYRWRNDDGNMETATPLSDEDQYNNVTVMKGVNFRYRVEVFQESSNTPIEAKNLALYYRQDNNHSNWIQISNNPNNAFQLALSPFFTEEDTINDYLTNTNGYPHAGGYTIESSSYKDFFVSDSVSYEIEYCIKATNSAEVNSSYLFTLREDAGNLHGPQAYLTVVGNPTPVPLSDWAIYLGVALMSLVILLKFTFKRF